jgi:hypothetical protein
MSERSRLEIESHLLQEECALDRKRRLVDQLRRELVLATPPSPEDVQFLQVRGLTRQPGGVDWRYVADGIKLNATWAGPGWSVAMVVNLADGDELHRTFGGPSLENSWASAEAWVRRLSQRSAALLRAMPPIGPTEGT